MIKNNLKIKEIQKLAVITGMPQVLLDQLVCMGLLDVKAVKLTLIINDYNRLARANIRPHAIFQTLSNEYGLTQKVIKDMVANGRVATTTVCECCGKIISKYQYNQNEYGYCQECLANKSCIQAINSKNVGGNRIKWFPPIYFY